MVAADRTPENDMSRLTHNQTIILNAAANREDGLLLPLPASLEINKSGVRNVLRSLVRRGLAEERSIRTRDQSWRIEDETPMTLVITDSGRDAVGQAPKVQANPASRARAGDAAIGAANGVRPKTKQSRLIDMLMAENGATLAELCRATGWQRHSVRGAISGTLKKKLGLTIHSQTVENRGRVYRIANDG